MGALHAMDMHFFAGIPQEGGCAGGEYIIIIIIIFPLHSMF